MWNILIYHVGATEPHLLFSCALDFIYDYPILCLCVLALYVWLCKRFMCGVISILFLCFIFCPLIGKWIVYVDHCTLVAVM